MSSVLIKNWNSKKYSLQEFDFKHSKEKKQKYFTKEKKRNEKYNSNKRNKEKKKKKRTTKNKERMKHFFVINFIPQKLSLQI